MPRPRIDRTKNVIAQRVQELLNEGKPLTVHELSAALDMSVPSMYRYITDMRDAGLVKQIGLRNGRATYCNDTPDLTPMVRTSDGKKYRYEQFWNYYLDNDFSLKLYADTLARDMLTPILCIPEIINGTLQKDVLSNTQKRLHKLRLELLKAVSLIDDALSDNRLWNETALSDMLPNLAFTKEELEAITLKVYPPKREYIDPINPVTDSSQETTQ